MFYFQPASRCLFFFFQRWTPRNKKITQSFLSTTKFITKYSSERFFFYLPRENISEGLLKFCKLISNLILHQIIDSNLNKRAKTCRITCARLHEIRYNKNNIKYNNYSGLPFEIQSLKDIKGGHSCLRLSTLLRIEQSERRKRCRPKSDYPILTSDAFLNQNPNKQTSHG